jgi:hypothetical protein
MTQICVDSSSDGTDRLWIDDVYPQVADFAESDRGYGEYYQVGSGGLVHWSSV